MLIVWSRRWRSLQTILSRFSHVQMIQNLLLSVSILLPEAPAVTCAEVYWLTQQGGLRQANLRVARVTLHRHDAA
jgi:hypothetical protein